jgi:hypothetical protein
MDNVFTLSTPSYQQAGRDPLLMMGPQVPVSPSLNGAGLQIQMILNGLRHVQEVQTLFATATAMVSGLVDSPVVTGSTLLPGYSPQRVRVSDVEEQGENSSSEAIVETNGEEVWNEVARCD